jgi:hypothetical protein
MSKNPFEMSRSHGQVSRAYAPGSLFTFEGGTVACIAFPDAENASAVEALTEVNRRQIAAIIQEYVRSWAFRAQQANNPRHEIPIELCVDKHVLNEAGAVSIKPGDLRFQIPQFAGLAPFPLAFRCAKCNLHREARSADSLAADMARFSVACPTGAETCANNWRQLDFVMAHWSGGIEAPSPRRMDRIEDGVPRYFDTCTHCNGKRFRWVGIGTGSLSSMQFACADCSTPRELRTPDPDTLSLLAPQLANQQALWAEVNMEPISYRANAVHYPHGDRVLLFPDEGNMRMLDSSRQAELAQQLAAKFGFPAGSEMTDAEKEQHLERAGRGAEWAQYVSLRTAIGQPGMPEDMVANFRAIMLDKEQSWATTVFKDHIQVSPGVMAILSSRDHFPNKFDPIRMVVEHDAFRADKINAGAMDDGRYRSVSVTDLDVFTRPDGVTGPDLDRLHTESRTLLDIMGIAEMRLVRDIRLCEFTFGYTRTSSQPIEERQAKAPGIQLPVRLRMFDKVKTQAATSDGVGAWLYPVLCVVSANEGFYVRLDENAVAAWIERNELNLPISSPGLSLGGRLLEQAATLQVGGFDGCMTQFLESFRRAKEVPEYAYPHVYTLLHTMAHQMICQIAALSGLEMSSLSEHIFAPDLAFLVYRRGTTMDLGNLSSMWRDRGSVTDGNECLARMADAASLRCGSESSCTHKGGACPDCIMIPETSCITRNDLLSRSALIGRGAPHWAKWEGSTRTELLGYYDVVAELRGGVL